MKKNIKILLIVVIIALIICIGAYLLLAPQYKSIEINGYALEVPSNDNDVIIVNENYKTYNDEKNNLSIKSYAINNVNETNYTGAKDIKVQLETNIGQNISLADKKVIDNNGTYTYYDFDSYQMIVITCKDKDLMEYMLKSLNKTVLTPNIGDLTLDLNTLSENKTENKSDVKTTTSTKKDSSKKTTKKSRTRSKDAWGDYEDDEWVYGHGAGASDDPNIVWKHNKKTGYGEYYNKKTGDSWGGYNIA